MRADVHRWQSPSVNDRGESSNRGEGSLLGSQSRFEHGQEISEPRQSLAFSASTVDDAEDWEIKSSELQLCHHPDGRPIELGSGAFGKVNVLVVQANNNPKSLPSLGTCL